MVKSGAKHSLLKQDGETEDEFVFPFDGWKENRHSSNQSRIRGYVVRPQKKWTQEASHGEEDEPCWTISLLGLVSAEVGVKTKQEGWRLMAEPKLQRNLIAPSIYVELKGNLLGCDSRTQMGMSGKQREGGEAAYCSAPKGVPPQYPISPPQ
ncbi:unnamed protein product [Pleuronectes platessa]|uniref:Uncharacterized protein n=1 Tax=Pleuronectes platessa TaxID=8262 RepID=A0A9N7Z9F5_PLEPL|nr:unnamed protein product [Pleuronectes platessa]